MERRAWSKNRIKAMAGCLLLAVSCFLSVLFRAVSGAAQWYSTCIYPIWVNVTGRIMGLVPFSVAEALLYVILLGTIFTGIRAVRRQWRSGRSEKNGDKSSYRSSEEISDKNGEKGTNPVCSWGSSVFLMASVLFFLYIINCGINYHRVSFSESSGIIAEEYSADDLKAVCRWLTQEVNARSGCVNRDADGVFEADDVQDGAVSAMQALGEEYPELAGYYPKPKRLIFPWILSVQNLTGVYSPFTVEANYNSGMVDYNKPFTACHELSHLRGFMQEEEANFIAFLACRGTEQVSFQYSGNLTGWIYCMNVLYKVDYEAWEEVRGELSPAVEADLRANREFWAKYDGAVAEVSNRVNDTYLKANGQEKGVKSYDHMVDLIVAYYKEEMS